MKNSQPHFRFGLRCKRCSLHGEESTAK
jgi:hypothetical protein